MPKLRSGMRKRRSAGVRGTCSCCASCLLTIGVTVRAQTIHRLSFHRHLKMPCYLMAVEHGS